MMTWIKNKKNVFSLAALALACICLISLSSILNYQGTTVDAQTVAGWSSRAYRQVPADNLTGISGGEALGYQFNLDSNATWDRARVADTVKQVALSAGTTETTVWTPASGKKFRLMGLVLTASAQTVLTFKDNTAGTTILTLELPANAPYTITPAVLGNGVLSAAANNVLTVTRGTLAALNGVVVGQEN